MVKKGTKITAPDTPIVQTVMQMVSATGNIHQNSSQYPGCIRTLLHLCDSLQRSNKLRMNMGESRQYTGGVLSKTSTQPARQTWASGDFPKMGVELAIVGEQLCEFVPVHAGDRVLDVGTASGNTAISAARRRAVVTGVDLVPELLDHARRRAQAEGLHIDFREGNAMALAFPDASFDAVLSTFGAIFAPDAEKTSAEMARVCRPGGTVAMANWTPDSLLGKLFRLLARYSPPESRVDAPVEWGDEAAFQARLGPYLKDLRVQKRAVHLRAPSAEQWVEFMRSNFGPAIEAFDHSSSPALQKQLTQEMTALIREHNSAKNGTVLGTSEYLEIGGTRLS
jgi:ubiquinone/menaquinone biosynthesis C-methylase UbiE